MRSLLLFFLLISHIFASTDLGAPVLDNFGIMTNCSDSNVTTVDNDNNNDNTPNFNVINSRYIVIHYVNVNINVNCGLETQRASRSDF